MSDGAVDITPRVRRGRRPQAIADESTPGSTVEIVQEPAQVETPVASAPAPVPGNDEWDLGKLRKILAVPKSKDSIPTLTCIDKGFYKRYFLLDVDGDAYREAWAYYKTHKSDATPDEFVIIVLRILEQDMPRMHRAVSYVPLL